MMIRWETPKGVDNSRELSQAFCGKTLKGVADLACASARNPREERVLGNPQAKRENPLREKNPRGLRFRQGPNTFLLEYGHAMGNPEVG
jgi:hypothetical protein